MKNRIKRNLKHLLSVEFVNLELQDHFVWVPKKKKFFGLITKGGYLKDTRHGNLSSEIDVDSLNPNKYVVEKFGNIPMVYLKTHLILKFIDGSINYFFYDDDDLAVEEYDKLMTKKFIQSKK